jgi:zinc transporter ZupT
MPLDLTASTVFLFALLTALATGLGAVPFLFLGQVSDRWLGLSNAVAAGLMAAASWSLISEGLAVNPGGTVLGFVVGVVFITGSRQLLRGRDVRWGEIQGADAARILVIVGVMTLHSFTEGVGLGVAFGGSQSLGVYITAAIALHNVPEGLAISLVLVPRGVKVWRAAGWSIFSSLPQPLMAVPAFWLVESVAPILPMGLGFAAGAMIWMIFSELLPEAYEKTSPGTVAVVVPLSISAMLLFQLLL